MKKTLLFSMLIGVCLSGYGQLNYPTKPGEAQTANTHMKPDVKGTHSTSRSVIWSEDFASGLASTNGTWTQNGTHQIWKHSFFTTSGEWSTGTPAFASTSAANGFVLFDADSANFTLSPNYIDMAGELISPTINLLGETTVILDFEHNFRWCCTAGAIFNLGVSNDGGTTWTEFDVTNSVTINSPSANPETNAINISSIAANQANVKIRFRFGATGNSHYYWAVDDITLSSSSSTDIGITNNYYHNVIEYTIYPTSQVTALTPCAVVNNITTGSATNVVVNADFNHQTAGVQATLASSTLAALTTIDTLCSSPSYVPNLLGNYTVDYSVSLTETDVDLSNNSSQQNFEVTRDVYGRDDNVVTISMFNGDDGAGNSTAFELGNLFEFTNIDTIKDVRIFIDANTDPGALVYGVLYEIDITGSFIYLNQTQDYTITSTDLGTWIILPLLNGVQPVSANTNILGLVGHYGGPDYFYVGGAQAARPQTSFLYDGGSGTWFYVNTTPMVRLGLDTSLVAISSAADITCSGACDGSATATVYGGIQPYTYLWDDPLAQTTATATGLCIGSYTCTVTDALGNMTSNAVLITGSSVLTASMSSTPSSGSDGTATVTASGGGSGYTYLWDDPLAQMTATASGLAPGTYNVIVTDINGCVFSDSINVPTSNGVDHINSVFQNLLVTPNPSADVFQINFNQLNSGKAVLRITNAVGQEVKLISLDELSGNKSIRIDASDWSAGVYFLQMAFEGKLFTGAKLIKD